MTEKKKWKIYIVGHKKIYDEMVTHDSGFNNDNYCFLNVGQNSRLENSEKYCCINQRDLPNFVSIGKYWAESEGIYNIWRSGIYKNLDYIGFLHYDIELRLCKKFFIRSNTDITKRINRYINKRERAHISFSTFRTKMDIGQKFMVDVNRPNEVTGDDHNCYEYILADYNEYFDAGYTLNDFLQHKNINLCSCFLIDVQAFDKMMGFFDWIVSSHKLDIFDTEHKYRFQGAMAERYFGFFLLFEYRKMLDLSLVHQYNRGWK